MGATSNFCSSTVYKNVCQNVCQKLIKNDILLSHVKLHKMRIITHLSEQKNYPKNTCKKKSEKGQPSRQNPTRIGKTENRSFRKPIGFGLGLGSPQGSSCNYINMYLKISLRCFSCLGWNAG
jgi:hypothetical protein